MEHSIFFTCYRVVPCSYKSYRFQVEVKRWWLPIWVEKWEYMFCNTFSTLEEAKEWIEKGCPKIKRKKTVYFKKCN